MTNKSHGLEERLRMEIKKVGMLWNEDAKVLDEYIEEQVMAWKHDLPRAINCFMDLAEQAKETFGLTLSKKDETMMAENEKSLRRYICPDCGYRPPFCRFDLYEKCSNIEK